jgi:hypothetical protein
VSRGTDLLRSAADALDDGELPLSHGFLSRNEVTSDEAAALAQQLAIGARLVVLGIEQPKSAYGFALVMSMAEEVMKEGT